MPHASIALWRRGVFALGLAFTTAACSATSSDPVLQALDAIEQAAEARDADAIAARLDEGFRGSANRSRAALASELRRLFLAYEAVDIERAEVHIERHEGGTRARLRAVFSGRPRPIGSLADILPRSAVYRLDVGLRPGPKGWLVTDATWEREVLPE